MDFFTDYKKHHLKVVDTLKATLYKKNQRVFEMIDFYDDDIYKEPFLYTCINSPDFELWIKSLLLGYSKIPNNKVIKIPCYDGIVYIPNVGYFHFKDKKVPEVDCVINSEEFLFYKNDQRLEYEFRQVVKSKLGIEILEYNHPLLKRMFINEKGQIIDVDVPLISHLNKEILLNFENALKKIRKTYKQYYGLIENYINKVVFYFGESNSFATIQAHGMIFINIDHGNSEVFFLDNILHQCAHVFFNTLTFDKRTLFKIPFSSDMAIFTGNKKDTGFPIYDRFHGLFTQSNINICFNKCLKNNLFSGESYIEFIAKFTSNMSRFQVSICKFRNKKNYKEKGLEWYNFFESTFDAVYRENKEVLSKYNVSNQPYVFDFELFLKTNNLR